MSGVFLGRAVADLRVGQNMNMRDITPQFRESYANLPDAELTRLARSYNSDRPEHIAAKQILEERQKIREEERHRELVEATKSGSGVYISSGGDTSISGGSIAGRDVIAASNNPAPHRHVIKWVFGIVGTIIGGAILAYMKGCFPEFLK